MCQFNDLWFASLFRMEPKLSFFLLWGGNENLKVCKADERENSVSALA